MCLCFVRRGGGVAVGLVGQVKTSGMLIVRIGLVVSATNIYVRFVFREEMWLLRGPTRPEAIVFKP